MNQDSNADLFLPLVGMLRLRAQLSFSFIGFMEKARHGEHDMEDMENGSISDL